MKRLMIALMLLALLVSAACAETRQGVIYLEGEAEPITETLYETPWGFSFWYDADLLAVDDSRSESGDSLMLLPTESGDLPVYMEMMLPETLGTTAWNILEENAEEGIEYESLYTETGTEILGFTKIADFNDGIIQGFYAAASDDGEQVAIFISCPMEAWEGWGHRLLHTLNTITFGPLPAVRVEDGEDQEGLPSIYISDDEYSVWVTFTARRPVTDFQVLDLEMAYDEANDSFTFNAETLYAQEALTPDSPVRVRLAFYGDIPNNGVSFVDEDGSLCRYAVDMSGEDGTLYLSAF